MPFKSEAQRRYLWANEPEIARDWTDTYGSKIHAADGGIMRLGFDNGGEVVDDMGHAYETSRYGNEYDPEYISEEDFNEMFGEETIGIGERITSGIDTMRDKFTGGVNWGKRVMSGIGNFIRPGLGFALGLLPRDTPAQKFNKSFTVGGANMPNDPYGYYNQLRHGNLNQDPFGRNPVSLFGNYSKNLLGDVNYEGENKFNLAKKDYAQNYFNQKAAQYAPQEDININVTPASLGGGNGGAAAQAAGDLAGGRDTWGASPFQRGGIAGLWPR